MNNNQRDDLLIELIARLSAALIAFFLFFYII